LTVDALAEVQEPHVGDVRRLARPLLRDQHVHEVAQQDRRAAGRSAARLVYADPGGADRLRRDAVLVRPRHALRRTSVSAGGLAAADELQDHLATVRLRAVFGQINALPRPPPQLAARA